MKYLYYIYFVLLFLFTVTLQAQDDPKEDDSKPPYNFNANQKGGLFLNDADTEVIYDAATGQYIFMEKVGDYYIKRPIYMTAKEYAAYRIKRDMISYYKEKTSAIDGKKKGSKDAKKNLLPTYYVNSKFFSTIFGSNEINVNAKGNVMVKFGFLYQKSENPQLSEKQRKSKTIDFDQQISASINAMVGTRLKVDINYDTQSTFDFQNLIKLSFNPPGIPNLNDIKYGEDDILQNIEIGNVSMPLQSSLIKGAQNLFGVKTKLKFGATEITLVGAKQQSQTRSVAAEGGATIHEFELRASDYDKDRHFFLSQRFRKDYDRALNRFPLINSSVNITRVEVWITNRNNATENVRNIIAVADIGERDATKIVNTSVSGFTGQDPSNEANSLGNLLTINGDIRQLQTIPSAFSSFGLSDFSQGSDYSVLENARKLNVNTDFTLHPQLGYISLNTALAESEVLAVAYEYTENGQVYTVGELSDNGIIAPANLVLKLLRPEIISTELNDGLGNRANPVWDLMMKNVYDLRSFQMNPDGFRLEILYEDSATGVPLNTLQNAQTGSINNTPLLNLLQIDRLDSSNNAGDGGDGFFDYVEGITVNSQKGLIFFPKVEPFGNFLDGIEEAGLLTETADEKFIFREMYSLTQSDVQNNYQSKDKYLLKGYYKSEGQNGIPLGASNVPRGSVVVTTGGRALVEGSDYIVDYQMGSVQIINPSLISSKAPIQVSVETNNAFSTQNRTFYGVDVQHKFSDAFSLGATFLKLNEKPFTQKAQFGSEPVNNSIAGINLTYTTDVPKLTKWVNYLPNIDTDAPSNFSIRAEAAYLMPNSPKGIELNGEAASYLDDFEGSQTPLNIDTASQWKFASTPTGDADLDLLDDDTIGQPDNFKYGNRRARFNWYTVDQLFYGASLRPDSIDDEELSRAENRRIGHNELYNEDLDITQSNIIRTLNLAYYPEERGSYNYEESSSEVDTNGKFTHPEDNWGGMMRALTTTDFQQANVEYLQFWMMDPFENYSITEREGAPSVVNRIDFDGELYINIGNISEDILHDGRKMFEHGLPKDGSQKDQIDFPGSNNVFSTEYSEIPTVQSLINAFTENDDERINQDVGLDGKNDAQEIVDFPNLGTDPSNDNFEYFRSSQLDRVNASILTRYKNFNRTQGNSATLNNSAESYPTTGTQYPDTEDLNRDQTMSTAESYHQYKVLIKENNQSEMAVGTNYIIDKVEKNVTLPNGESKQFTWYQFRIPLQSSSKKIGGISSFNSIRFMRIFLTKFKIPVVLRVANLEMVRSDWRRYTKILKEPLGATDVELDEIQNQNFEVGVVNLFENEGRYFMPPGVEQERLQGSTSVQRQNEQSLSLKITDLKLGETRAVYKNTSFDMRMFKKFKMFIHLEKHDANDTSLKDGDLSAIIRLGSDVKDNYYQIEVPLLISTKGSIDREELWKNNIEAVLEDFGKLRLERHENNGVPNEVYPINGKDYGNYKLFVKGNPTLAKVKTMMLGVKNTGDIDAQSAELWFNEMRVVDFDNEGGWSAVASANVNIADFMDIAASGGRSTKGFGSLDQRVNERSQDDMLQYDLVSNISLGQLLPKKLSVSLPLNVSVSEKVTNPKYDPQYQDVLFEDTNSTNSPNRNSASDYTKRRSISLINVGINGLGKKNRIYNPKNVSVSFAYDDAQHHDYNVEKANEQNVRASASYNYTIKSKPIEPFKKIGFIKRSKYLKLLKDFNFNYLPSSFSVNTNIQRSYNEFLARPLIQGSSLPDLPTLERRDYAADWQYNISYNVTKSLKLKFIAANAYINDVFDRNDQNEIVNGQIFNKFFAIGRPDHYHQKLDASYKIPVDKIPFLDFVKSNYSYTGDFDWQASSRDNVALVGNTIQNANTHNFNADFNMKKLYKDMGVHRIFNKKYNDKRTKDREKNKAAKLKEKEAKKKKEDTKKKKEVRDKKQDSNKKSEKETKSKIAKNKSTKKAKKGRATKRKKSSRKAGKFSRKNLPIAKKVVLGLIDVVTSVQKIRLSYTANNGTILPGYVHNVGFLGRDSYTGGIAPSYGFVFGQQEDILSAALANNWIVTRGGTDQNLYPYFNKTYSRTHLDKFDYKVTLKPFKDFNIDVSGTRTFTRNSSQQIDVIDDGIAAPYMQNSPMSEIGNYSMSHLMIATSFTDSEQLFTNFLANRTIISQRLAEKTGYNEVGYGQNSQDVLLPAFIATYSGENLNKTKLEPFKNIPLPNWKVSYKGLSKIKWIKKRFKTVTIDHSYKSAYSILGFSTNLEYDTSNPLQTDITGVNYVSKMLFSGVNLIEAFSPLVKLDVKMKNSFSFRGSINTDRSLDLNFANSSITEVKGREYVLGLGYKLKNVKWRMRLGKTKKIFKGDVDFKADFALRNNETHIRSFETLSDQITAGQTIMTFKVSADYNLNKNLMASFFYDQNSSKFAISTSFPRKSISTGISIRYNIGN